MWSEIWTIVTISATIMDSANASPVALAVNVKAKIPTSVDGQRKVALQHRYLLIFYQHLVPSISLMPTEALVLSHSYSLMAIDLVSNSHSSGISMINHMNGTSLLASPIVLHYGR